MGLIQLIMLTAKTLDQIDVNFRAKNAETDLLFIPELITTIIIDVCQLFFKELNISSTSS